MTRGALAGRLESGDATGSDRRGGGDSLYRWYRWLVEEAQLRRLEHDSEQAEESAGRKRFARER